MTSSAHSGQPRAPDASNISVRGQYPDDPAVDHAVEIAGPFDTSEDRATMNP
jgi:hypothetical protein